MDKCFENRDLKFFRQNILKLKIFYSENFDNKQCLPFVFFYKRSLVNHVNEIYSPCNSFTLSIVVLISTYQQGDIVLEPLYLVL